MLITLIESRFNGGSSGGSSGYVGVFAWKFRRLCRREPRQLGGYGSSGGHYRSTASYGSSGGHGSSGGYSHSGYGSSVGRTIRVTAAPDQATAVA